MTIEKIPDAYLASAAVQHCCRELGVRAEALSGSHLFEFASVLHKRLGPFLGPEASAGLARKIRKLAE